jgi:DNA-binding MarR family transcriptional regulator
MRHAKRTPAGTVLSDLILDVFRLSNRLLASGDRLVAQLGLTSARWQVLGSIIAAERPQPVAWLARDMGASRQNIQRIVNDLEREGLVAFRANPHHRRAQLVLLTDKGQQTFDTAMQLQGPWIDKLADGLKVSDLETIRSVVVALRRKLEAEGDAAGSIDSQE